MEMITVFSYKKSVFSNATSKRTKKNEERLFEPLHANFIPIVRSRVFFTIRSTLTE